MSASTWLLMAGGLVAGIVVFFGGFYLIGRFAGALGWALGSLGFGIGLAAAAAVTLLLFRSATFA